MPYEESVDLRIIEGVMIRFSWSGRPIRRYAVVLLVLDDGEWQTARLFDNHKETHHMHRYTLKDGKKDAEIFHPGPTNAAIPAAIRHLTDHWEAIIESWRT
jgi:aspartate carbamoyltransferase catalytic subunit